MDANALVINSDCVSFINEMNYFQMTENDRTWRMKYEAIEGHDDYVNAAMVWVFYVYSVMSEKYTMMVSSTADIWKIKFTTEEVLNMLDDEKDNVKRLDYDTRYKNFMKNYWF